MRGPGADDISAKGHVSWGCPESEALGVAGQVQAIAREEIDLAALRFEFEAARSVCAKRIGGIKHYIPASRNNSAERHNKLLGRIKMIGEEPAADVRRTGR